MYRFLFFNLQNIFQHLIFFLLVQLNLRKREENTYNSKRFEKNYVVAEAAYFSFIKRVYVAIYLVDKYVLQKKIDKTFVGWKQKAVSHNEEILL